MYIIRKWKKLSFLLLILVISSDCIGDTVFVHNTRLVPDSFYVKSINVGVNQDSFWGKNLQICLSSFLGIGAIALSIISILVSKKNLDKQLRIQLATTIQKEWVENVRLLLADMIRNSIIMAHYKQHKGDSGEGDIEQYNGAFDEFQNKQILLSLYLDLRTDKEFFDLVGELRNNSEDGNMVTVNTIIREIQLKSQELFNSKYHY